MRIHHTKHHQAYTDNFNKAIENTNLKNKKPEEIIMNLNLVPENIRTAVRNNGGGYVNHKLFWQILKKDVKIKGEIFIKKNWFGGKYIKTPVAIDKAILDTLIKFGCKSIQILILGVSNQSYVVSFNPQWIKDNGRIINYDVIKQGRNITHFGTQIVWEMDDGLIGGSKQTLLKN